MALAEVRAAWQRTANRCLVQEDAKRAPKLACCSSVPPSLKQTETEQTSPPGGQEYIPTTGLPPPFGGNPSYSNLSPNSRWWLQLNHHPNYCFQKGLVDEQINFVEGNMETHCISQAMYDESSSDDHCMNFSTPDQKNFGNNKEESRRELCSQDPFKLEDVGGLRAETLVGSDVSKKFNDQYLDSESSFIMAEKNTPWWRTADTEELALLVAQRSLDLIDNCDLPSPQNSRLQKDVNGDISRFSCDKIHPSPRDPKPGFGSHSPFTTQAYASGNRATGSSPKLRMSFEAQSVSPAGKPLRDSPRHERMQLEARLFENDASKAQLLEALRHSQTRAREAEKAARQACIEKEHVIKLVFRQASQLFAYKQWLQLLQLENMYFQFKTNKNQTPSEAVPIVLHWTPLRTRKLRKNGQNTPRKKRATRSRTRYDVGKYAVVFALGLGLVGAGLFLGWTVGWMLPMW